VIAVSACIVIPCRFGNQEIEDKNLQEVLGLTLIERTLRHAMSLPLKSSRICISSNCPERVLPQINRVIGYTLSTNMTFSKNNITQLSENLDIHNREAELSTPESPIMDSLLAIRSRYLSIGIKYRYWILLQPTSPFRSSDELSELANRIQTSTEEIFSLFSVKNVSEFHPARMYREENGKLRALEGFHGFELKRRQELEKIYIRDGAFYIVDDKLLEKGKLVDEKPYFILRHTPWSINVDSKKDLQEAQNTPLIEVINDPCFPRDDSRIENEATHEL
jgi:CMP-N-acetylneuraminic acid synthetase